MSLIKLTPTIHAKAMANIRKLPIPEYINIANPEVFLVSERDGKKEYAVPNPNGVGHLSVVINNNGLIITLYPTKKMKRVRRLAGL